MKRMYEDSGNSDRNRDDEKELLTPAIKYEENFVFEKSYPLMTICKQLQHAIDNVRILRLQNLNLGEYLPDGLLEFTPSSCIEELDLSMTKLNILPPSIGKLQCLKRLYLDHNGLRTLPFSITHCKYLTYLSLTFNKFSFFPGILLTLTCLTDLRRQSNPTQPSLSLLAGARFSNYIRRIKCTPNKSDVKPTGEVPSLREMVIHTAILSNIGRPYWRDESIPYMIVRQLDSAQNDYMICDNCHCAIHKGDYEGVLVEWLHEEFLGLKMLPFQSFTCSSVCADALVKRLIPKQERIMEGTNRHSNYQLRLNSSTKSATRTSSCSIQ